MNDSVRIVDSTNQTPTRVPIVSDVKLDAALLILRVWVGAMMFIHGWPKVFGGIEKFTEGVAKLGFPAPEVFAWAAALSELVGGLLLALGLYTRVSAVFIASTMLVAAFIRLANEPFVKQELPITFLAIAIALILVGSGRFSLDNMIRRAKRIA